MSDVHGVGRRRCAALGIAALYHHSAIAHCDLRPTPMQEVPRRGQRCLQLSAGPAPRPPEAHHYPVTMSAPGRRASLLQIVVIMIEAIQKCWKTGRRSAPEPPRYHACTMPWWIERPFRACIGSPWPHPAPLTTQSQACISGIVKIAFIIARTRKNVVVLFGTLKVQSFMLAEVRDCDLLTRSCCHIFYFSQKKRHVKRKKQLAQIIKTHSTAFM